LRQSQGQFGSAAKSAPLIAERKPSGLEQIALYLDGRPLSRLQAVADLDLLSGFGLM
jgi:hypothetical protein